MSSSIDEEERIDHEFAAELSDTRQHKKKADRAMRKALGVLCNSIVQCVESTVSLRIKEAQANDATIAESNTTKKQASSAVAAAAAAKDDNDSPPSTLPAAATKKKAGRPPKKDKKRDRSPSPEKKEEDEQPKKKGSKKEKGEWKCVGNPFTDEPCPGDTEKHLQPAAQTTVPGKGRVDTCKACKAAIAKSRKLNKESAVAAVVSE